ncbi:MAG: amidophosphoribosyltransferase [Oscillospiraceae bacterium]|jgi:amidophosphoribosyltransferase|nr:amidophosphoribosyltransferase [Oscillospiraceae bacterium]
MTGNIKEECGVFGIYTREREDVAFLTYQALYALQHRGQESCGIVVNDRGVFSDVKELGLVNEVFTKEKLQKLGTGQIALGHVRYSTTGNVSIHNAQPMTVRHVKGPMAIAHNGNLVNARELREEYELIGGIFHSTSDSEVISYAITEQRLYTDSIQDAAHNAMRKIKGAYSVVMMSPKKLVAMRDPNGFRPLCLGELGGGKGYVAASESCALDSIGAKFIRDLLPGEVVVIDDNGISSVTHKDGKRTCGGNLCVFEYVYFARPDSVIEGVPVHEARMRAGRFLAQEHPVDADIVIGVPDSGVDAGLGFSRESGIPYETGLIKNRYVGRTFIQPSQAMRESSVRIKLNPVMSAVKGKRVVIIDDSIVRGTTTKILVNLIREAGAKEVHVRISSPPFMHPCFFGTDIDSRDRLIACQMPLEKIAASIGADSLGYLSIEHVNQIAKGANVGMCDGCFSGKYPIDVPDEMPKDKFEYKLQC